ncbi:C45 family autoproteolytic acyltransferase/hydolase [Halobacillus amylolyticus]|uniref:C45 family peptidase n=1 Tax=Halobacillus amylolyticus TaxID=2932259 RepID=A0ABY4H9X3_9BACI|nr:C45 family peptidase [Halobacillus amylolyticus]UOR11356.1 C45 family peptidase [Halobacillus amylolyticus]
MNEKFQDRKQILKLSGSSYEIGFKHGEKAKEKVHTTLQTYEKMFHQYSNMSWKDSKEKALLHLKAIEKYNSNYLEEMEGLAKGASVSFEDILAINARSEIALITGPDGCTSFGLTNPKTSKTWLAQNWDWKGSQIDALVQLDIEQEGFPSIQMITEAGIIGKIGSNSEGIGVCLNALVTDAWEPKTPIHLGLRAVLESYSLKEAISKVDHNQMASAAHFLIASKSEETIGMEVSPVFTGKINSEKGVVTHTNHICSADLKEIILEDALSNSFTRLTTIDSLLEQLEGENITKNDLFHILSNHDHFPDSICRHSLPHQSGRQNIDTVFSIVMNLTDHELFWSEGRPCEQF